MLVIDITYTKPFSEVEKHLQPHRDFLKQCYETGKFLASGPKNPRTGGIIIGLTCKAEAEALIQQDPFYQQQVAEFTITEFNPVMHHAVLNALTEDDD